MIVTEHELQLTVCMKLDSNNKYIYIIVRECDAIGFVLMDRPAQLHIRSWEDGSLIKVLSLTLTAIVLMFS